MLVFSQLFLKCLFFFLVGELLSEDVSHPLLLPLFYQCDRCLVFSSPDHTGSYPPTPFSPSFHCLNSVMGACSSYCLRAHDWDVSGFASHGSSLHLRASPVNNGNSWMSCASSLHFARQPLICVFIPFFTIQEHNGRVFRLQFDDFQIVSSSHDDTILMWDFLNYSPDQNGKGTVTTLR